MGCDADRKPVYCYPVLYYDNDSVRAFFKLYLYTAIAPVPLATFAGEPTQHVGKSFIKELCCGVSGGSNYCPRLYYLFLVCCFTACDKSKCGGCNTGMELRRGS